MGSRHGDEVRNREAGRRGTQSGRDTDPRSCHSMWVAERPGGSLAVCPAPRFALCPHFLSVCLGTGPRPTPGEAGNSGKEGACTPQKRELFDGLGQGLPEPLRPPGWGVLPLCSLYLSWGGHIFVYQLLTGPSYGGVDLPPQNPQVLGKTEAWIGTIECQGCHVQTMVKAPRKEEDGRGLHGGSKSVPRTPGWQGWVFFHLEAKSTQLRPDRAV